MAVSSVPLCWQRRLNTTIEGDLKENLKDIKEKLFKNAELSIIKNGRITANVPLQRTVPLPRKIFAIDWRRGFLFWRSEDLKTSQSNKEEGYVDLFHVHEIVREYRFKFDREINIPEASCFSIYYGVEFNLNVLILYSKDGGGVVTDWIHGLKVFCRHLHRESYWSRSSRILQREYNLAISAGRSFNLTGNPDTIKTSSMLQNYFKTRGMSRTERNRLREDFQDFKYERFQELFQQKLNAPFDIHTDKAFERIPRLGDILRSELEIDKHILHRIFDSPLEDNSAFLKALNEPTISAAMDGAAPTKSPDGLSKSEFALFLFSEENSLLNPSFTNCKPTKEYLSAPMCHYWINSSHNTYLTGNQYSSLSSVECYVRALRHGCRCIELDCWNGRDGSPLILHGHTMTPPILLEDAVKAINEHAFATTDLPLILSIENHCNVEQQDTMAYLFAEHFKNKLLTVPIDEGERQLPSPWELRNRIIIKNRKLKSQEAESKLPDGDNNGDNDVDHDYDDKQFQGVLNLIGEDGSTFPKYVTLFDNGELQFSEIKKNDLTTDEPEESTESTDEVEKPPANDGEHNGQRPNRYPSWFHSDISRHQVVTILKSDGSDGAWLVRNSKNFPGDFTLSIVRGGKVEHVRIIKDYRTGATHPVFFLEANNPDHPECDSLETLIDHYKNKGISARLKLMQPVPVPQQHLRMSWFYDNLTRDQAMRALLHNSVIDGQFLVRQKDNETEFGLSFRYDQDGPAVVKHGKITQVVEDDATMYKFGDMLFPSLVLLVEYYHKNPFYKGQTLRDAIDRGLLQRVISQPLTERDSEEYVDHSTVLRVQAEHKYDEERADEISLMPGDFIKDVKKLQRDWWTGTHERTGKEGWFPANYVREAPEDNIQDLLQEAIRGKLQLTSNFTIAFENNIILLRDNVSNKSLKLAQSGIGESETLSSWNQAELSQLAQSIRCYLDKSQQSNAVHQKQKNIQRLSSKLSNQIVYCQAVTWDEDVLRKSKSEHPGIRDFRAMSSIGESKIHKYLDEKFVKDFLDYNSWQISRTYPKGARLHSENYNPVPCWNGGCQMVALNFQTPDLGMQLNHAKFSQNQNCGFVRKPEYMLSVITHWEKTESDGTKTPGQSYCDVAYNPCDKHLHSIHGVKPKVLTIHVLAGRHIFGLGKTYQGLNTSNVDYAIEIIGVDVDKAKHRFKQEVSNTFNPTFDKSFSFRVANPDLAFLKFTLSTPDAFGDNHVIALAVYPFPGLQEGIRSVPLMNTYMEPIEQAAMLISCTITDETVNHNQ